VIEALRTWAAKRDRLAVYQGINLLEFLSKDDRDDALSRGHKGLPLADRYILVEQEEEIDYRHFRTLGSRDYMLPPTQCVLVAEDGVTLTVDPTRADLLLETELLRFTTASLVNDTRQYRLSSETLNQARTQGLSFRFLSEWFTQRTGLPITAAARLLWPERETAKLPTEMVMILRAADETQADGLWQWPETRVFLQDRLGTYGVPGRCPSTASTEEEAGGDWLGNGWRAYPGDCSQRVRWNASCGIVCWDLWFAVCLRRLHMPPG
jgi:hypothetical protein